MREILYRGKTAKGEWINGDLLQGGYDYETAIWEKETKLVTEVLPESVSEFTGLTDKNGKKIFEGDIVAVYNVKGYVLFENGCFVFLWKNHDKHRPDFYKKCILTNYVRFNELEVIGNIHDNPELLKGGAE